ncbi:hypothetical protein GGR57DRAFT_159005 [Xylariaceae sp. FL1272]|nr:hypothetical protein GGR57DRAFT_159005 [Xylariaceae sp. FL1272]
MSSRTTADPKPTCVGASSATAYATPILAPSLNHLLFRHVDDQIKAGNMAAPALSSHLDQQTAAKAKDKITVVLSERGDSKTVAERHIVLSRDHPTVPIGRASKVLTKGFVPAKDNAWFENPVMSREHAELSVVLDNQESPAVYIQDVESFHGTFYMPNDGLNQERRLQPRQRQKLVTGDIIRFGIDIFRHNSGSFPPCCVDVLIEDMDIKADQRAPPVELPKPGFSVPDDIDDEDDEDLFVPTVVEDATQTQSPAPRCDLLNHYPNAIDLTVDSENSVRKPSLSSLQHTMSDVIDLTSEAGPESIAPSPVPSTPRQANSKTQDCSVIPSPAPLLVVNPPSTIKAMPAFVLEPENDSESELEEDDGMELPCGSSQRGSSVDSDDGYSSHELHALDADANQDTEMSSDDSSSNSSRASSEVSFDAPFHRWAAPCGGSDVATEDSYQSSDESELESELSEPGFDPSELGDEYGTSDFEEEVDEASDTLIYLPDMVDDSSVHLSCHSPLYSDGEDDDVASEHSADGASTEGLVEHSSVTTASQSHKAGHCNTLQEHNRDMHNCPAAPPFLKSKVETKEAQPSDMLAKNVTQHVRDPSPSDAALFRRLPKPDEQRAQLLGEKSGKFEYFQAREDNRAFYRSSNGVVKPVESMKVSPSVPEPSSRSPCEYSWLAEGTRFINNPSIDELPPLGTAQDLVGEYDMTSAYTFQQSQMAAKHDHLGAVSRTVATTQNSSSVPQRVKIADLLEREPKQASLEIVTNTKEPAIMDFIPAQSRLSPPRTKRSFQEAFIDDVVTPRSPLPNRHEESDSEERCEPDDEHKRGSLQLSGDQQDTSVPETLAASAQPEVGRPSKKLRLAQAGACVLLGGAAAFSFLVNTAPVF